MQILYRGSKKDPGFIMTIPLILLAFFMLLFTTLNCHLLTDLNALQKERTLFYAALEQHNQRIRTAYEVE